MDAPQITGRTTYQTIAHNFLDNSAQLSRQKTHNLLANDAQLIGKLTHNFLDNGRTNYQTVNAQITRQWTHKLLDSKQKPAKIIPLKPNKDK